MRKHFCPSCNQFCKEEDLVALKRNWQDQRICNKHTNTIYKCKRCIARIEAVRKTMVQRTKVSQNTGVI